MFIYKLVHGHCGDDNEHEDAVLIMHEQEYPLEVFRQIVADVAPRAWVMLIQAIADKRESQYDAFTQEALNRHVAQLLISQKGFQSLVPLEFRCSERTVNSFWYFDNGLDERFENRKETDGWQNGKAIADALVAAGAFGPGGEP